MTEHVHEWRIKYNMTNGDIYAESHSKDGKWLKTIFKDELEARLNATERLSAEYVRSLSNIDWEIIVDAIEDNVDVKQYTIRLWNRYDASAQRAYANILEGK